MPIALDHISLAGSSGFGDYALLDSGHGRKLERFGKVVLIGRRRRRCGIQL